MKVLKIISLVFLIVTIFFSCEKVVEIDIDYEDSQLVVEGYIQQGYPSYVFLTKSEHYFIPVDSNTLNNLVVKDAYVFVEREDGIVHELTYVNQSILDSLDLLSETIELPPKALYIDFSYQSDNFSQLDYSYKLIVVWKDDTLSATTYIPPIYPIDSVWVKRKESTHNHKCFIWAQINDPDTLGNFFTAYYKRDLRWKPMDPVFNACAISVRTDNIINGENLSTYFARSGRVLEEDGGLLPFDAERIVDGKVVKSDIVLLRISHVNRSTYSFFRSLSIMENSTGNPFAEPMNLSSNIDGGLGIWAGYGVSYYYIPIVPDTVIYNAYDDVGVFEIF
jgi:hypothetical protein